MVSPDMRATLVNKVFRQFWKVSDALSESNPPLAELLRNGPIETAPTATIAASSRAPSWALRRRSTFA